VSTWSHSCSPANRPAAWHGTSSLGRPGGERGPQPGRWRPSTLMRALNANPRPSRPRGFGPGRRPRRSRPHGGTSNLLRPTEAAHRTDAFQHPALRTARTQATDTGGVSVRTPGPHQSCGHRTCGHRDVWTPGRVDTGRPPDYWTDARTADRRRGPGDYRRGRRPDSLAATATATAGWAPKPRLGCRICGARQPMTARGDDTCRRGDWAAAQQCST